MNLKVIIMGNNKRSFIMEDITLKNMDGCTKYSKKKSRSFWYLTFPGKTRFYTFLVTISFFLSHFLSLCELTAVIDLWHGISQSKCEKGWNNVVQIIKTFLVKQSKKAATVFSVCIEHHHKAKNKNLGFAGAR